jgi:predicted RND superfamily exporter protein
MRLHGTLNMQRDLLLFIPITILLIAVVFFISFRTVGGVLLPLATISMAVIWTVGLMSLLNKPLTVVTLSLPAVILAIGSSYIVHVINQYYISTAKLSTGQGIEERRTAVFDALAFIKGPVLVSGTITMAGFLSLATGEIQGSRDMGYFAAFGMLASTLLALTFVPAVLILMKTPAARSGGSNYASYLDGILRTLGNVATERQKIVYWVTGALCLVSLIGFTKLQVNTDYRAFFKKSSPIYQATEKVHRNLAGCATFEMVIDGGRPGSIMEPQVLQAMQKLQDYSKQIGADAAFSFSDIVGVVNAAVAGNPKAGLPTDKMTLDDLDKDYLSHDEDSSHLITSDRSKAVVLIRTDFYGSNQMRDFLSKVEADARMLLPQSFKVNTTGIFVLLNHASDSVASQQATSLTVAMVLILAMVTVLFKSFKLGIMAIIPNTIPILFTFGFMGWSGITLDINTSLVASIVLGLAVDNAVHFIVRFARNRRSSSSGNREAVILSLMQSGKPIIFANLTLVFAFAIFILSQFNPIQISGMLSSVAIFACMIGNLLLLPVLLTSYAVKSKDGYAVTAHPSSSEHKKPGTRKEEISLR